MKEYYCNGKKDVCGDECSGMCGDCEHYNGKGGVYIEVDSEPTKSEAAERREDIENSPADCSTPSGPTRKENGMSRYIDADKLIERLKFKRDTDTIDRNKYAGLECAIAQCQKAPTADVVEVRHGEWVVDAYNGDEIVQIPYKVHEHDEPYCSLCRTYALLDGKEDYMPSNFCPNCGAKMDVERGENETFTVNSRDV